MKEDTNTIKQLLNENEELRIQLAEAQETLQAISEGAVDAVVVRGPAGEQIFTLTGQEQIYRHLVEAMSEGGLTTTLEGRILFCNERFSEMVGRPMEEIVGRLFQEFIQESSGKDAAALLADVQIRPSKKRLVLLSRNGVPVPLHISANLLCREDMTTICMVAMDLSELEASEEVIHQVLEQKKALEETSIALRDSRRAALNIMEDALTARQQAETLNAELQREISERKEAEDALRQSEQRFRALAEALPQIVWTADADGDIEWYNRRWYEYTGGPESGGLGWNWDKVAHPDDMAHTLRNWRDALQRGSLFQNDIRIRRHDGQYRWFLVRAWPMQDTSGKVVRWFGTNTDVHDFKLAEEALRENEQRMQMAMKLSRSFAFEWDPAADRVLRSDSCGLILGLSGDDALHDTGQNYFQRVHPLDRERFVQMLGELKPSADTYCTEYRLLRPDGSTIILEESGRAFFDMDGKLSRVMGFTIDISRRKQIEESLREIRDDLNRAQAVSNIGSWRLDIQKNVLTWSDENHRIFGIPKGTPMTYETFLSVVHPDDRQYVDAKWKAGLAGEDYDIEHRLLVDGRVKWVREKAYLEFDENGTLQGGFGITQDITVRKQMEEDLRKSRDELEMRVKERTHELAQTVNILENEVRERILAEKEVKAERKRFEDVLEMMPAYAILLKPDYHIAYANHTFRKWFGDNNGKKCYEFLFNRSEACENCETYTVLKTGKNHFWEWIGPNGRNYDIYDYPFTDTDGSPLIMEIGVDVTPHKKAQEAVREGEKRYRSLTLATSQIVWITDAQGQVATDMPSWRAFTGQSEEEIRGWGWINSLHPEDRDRTAKVWAQSVQDKSFYQTEYRLKRLDGMYRYVSVRGVPVIESDGSIREWIGTCTDITERKQAEEKQNIVNLLLELFVKKTSRKEYLDAVVQVIRQWTSCHCVGIRLVNPSGWIPYESCVGFDDKFLAQENMISLHQDTCACVRVITQIPDPQESTAVTPRGSFHSANTHDFFGNLSERDKSRYRGQCPKCGFGSVAVIPIRYREEVLGAIHLADPETDKISSDAVEFLESMAMLIGEALYRFDTEMSLRFSESRLREAQRIARLGNWEWEIQNNKLFWSDEIYRIFGIRADKTDVTYDFFLHFVHPEDRPLIEQAVKNAIDFRQSYNINHRIIREEGIERIVHEQAEVIYDDHGKPVRMVGTVQDVTEQEIAEKELRQSQEKLRLLAMEIVLTEERERRTIAAALHDSLGPLLAFSKRELGILRKSAPDELTESLAYVHEKIKQAVEQTRNLTFDLSPTTLYTLGLEHALEELVEHFSREGSFCGVCQTGEINQPLTDDVKILVYRSVRELLVNIVKHAQAKNVLVALTLDENNIQVTVQDDGVGFNISGTDIKTGKMKGFGLFNIYERLVQAGGRVDIQSHETKGIKVTMVLPFNYKKE